MTHMLLRKRPIVSALLLLIALSIPIAAIEKEPLSEYASRRARVAEEIKGNALILYGNEDSELVKFKQEDNFYYLTGFSEPDAVLVIDATGEQPEETLFIEPRNPSQERWTGVTTSSGADGEKATGLKSVRILSDLAGTMARITQKGRKLYTLTHDTRTMDQVRSLNPRDVQNAEPILANLRVRKSPTELALLEKTIKISVSGQEAAARIVAPGVWEYEVEAAVEYEFRRRGAERPSFPSIIGSGPNSTVLHYNASTRQMQAGDLVVVDIGSEYGGYAGDVTRTYPVSGKFTARQREIYQIVLDAQKRALAVIKPGVTMQQVHQAAANYIRSKGYDREFPHGTSHFLGLYVHDLESYVHDVGPSRIALEPGMVITVEPGIYLDKEQLGVRIEDDVVITENGYRMLSDFPREIAEIEALMARSSANPRR
jgi:Xaa-Pro aminopeptidase